MKRLLLPALLVVSAVMVTSAAFDRKASTQGQPTVTRAVAPPSYPAIARQAHAGGKVVVEVTLDDSGKVASAKAVEGHPLLQKAAETGAKQWLFQSGTEGRIARLTFRFSVGDGETDRISFMPPYEVEFVSRRAEIISTHESPQLDLKDSYSAF